MKTLWRTLFPSRQTSAASGSGDMLFGMGARILYALTRLGLPALALAHMSLVEYGLWASAFVLISYLGMASSGFTLVYLREAAKAYSAHDMPALNRLLVTGMSTMGALAALLWAAVYVCMPALLNALNVPAAQQALAAQLWLISIGVFLMDMSVGAFANVLHAVGLLRQEQKVWIAAFLLEAVLIVLLLHAGWGVMGLVGAFAGRYLFSISVNAWLAYRALPGLHLSWRAFDARLLRSFFGYGTSAQISSLLASALQSVDRVLASVLFGPQATALVDLGTKFPSTAASITGSASTVAMVNAAREQAQASTGQAEPDTEHQQARTRTVYRQALLMTSLSLGLILPFMAIFSEALTRFWLGTARSDAELQLVAQLMTLAAVGAHFHLLTGPATAVRRGCGQLWADYAYHGLRILALSGVVLAWIWHGPVPLQDVIGWLCAAQICAALVFCIWQHAALKAHWFDLWRLCWLPALGAYALGFAVHWHTTLPESASRWEAAWYLLERGTLWLTLTGLLMVSLMHTHAQRQRLRTWARAALTRVLHTLHWRRS